MKKTSPHPKSNDNAQDEEGEGGAEANCRNNLHSNQTTLGSEIFKVNFALS
mgnify:CR=1 FL=1